jgi:hypothetical protein
MRKMLLLVFFSLLVCGQIFAQSEPIMGYDQVKWGASVNDVRKAFNVGNNIVLQESYGGDPNSALLEQKNVSESIEERSFAFNKYKGNYQLYRVTVTYKDASNRTMQNLKNLLENKYGGVTDTDRNSESSIQMHNGAAYLFEEVQNEYIFGKYSPELVIVLYHTLYGNVGGSAAYQPTGLIVQYTWKKFRDEYRAWATIVNK